MSIAAGTLIGLAGIVTIKSIFIALPIGIIILWNLLEEKINPRKILFAASTCLSSITIFALYIFFRKTNINQPHTEHINIVPTGDLFNKINDFNLTFTVTGIRSLLLSLFQYDTVFWILVIASLYILFKQLLKPDTYSRQHTLTLLTLAIPLSTFLFYRNTYPYYYVFVLPPVAILCAPALQMLSNKFSSQYIIFLQIIIICFICMNTVRHGLLRSIDKNMQHQQTMVNNIHKIFPEPVTYIDQCGMISEYKKTGFFMSTIGFQNYWKGNFPLLKTNIIHDEPKFLIGSEKPSVDTTAIEKNPFNKKLKQEDLAFISQNYIHHWQELYVAGKHFKISSNTDTIKFNIVIQGTYTLENNNSVFIDGKEIIPNAVIYLEKGKHIITEADNSTEITLRWGDNIYTPPTEQRQSPKLFAGF